MDVFRHLSISYFLANVVCMGLVLAAQAHFFIWLRRRLRERGAPRADFWSYLFLAAALCLILGSDWLSIFNRMLGDARQPSVWRQITSIWVAGSLGAYLAILGLSGLRRILGKRRAAPAAAAGTQDGSISRRDLVTTAAAACPFAVAGYGVFIGRTNFQVQEVELKFPNLPDDLDGLRIGQLTDIHAGPYLSLAEIERAVDMLNETRPDLAVLTGDLITTWRDPLEGCIRKLAKIKAPAGILGCHGNHERYTRGENEASRLASPYGIDFLRQDARDLRFGDAVLNVVGVDYQSKSNPYLTGADQLTRPDAFNLLLSHNPDVFPVAKELGYDLVIGGHTHGGQITVEIVDQYVNPGLFFTPFVAGEYRIGGSALYVSRGIGCVNLPMRIGALPEITLLRLKKA